MFGSFRSACFEFRLKRSGDAPAGDCLQSLSGAALQQFFATAQARKAAEILLVSEVADQYLTLLQFHTGTGTELAVSQAQTVVEQARANYSAEVRGRAQAENALVLLLGQPLPADLPPAVPLNSQTLLADIPACLPADLLARRPDVLQAEATRVQPGWPVDRRTNWGTGQEAPCRMRFAAGLTGVRLRRILILSRIPSSR